MHFLSQFMVTFPESVRFPLENQNVGMMGQSIKKRIVPPLLRCRDNSKGSIEYPKDRRESMEYLTGCDFAELRQSLSARGDLWTSFSRSSA